MRETQEFQLAVGDRHLHGIVTLPVQPGPRPTVVICHGFKGFMEWGFFPHLADLLAERGFTAIRFNFYGSGMLPGDERVTDLQAFRSATFGRDLEELGAIFAAAGGSIAAGRVDRGRMGLLGHSRGGGTAILAAASPTLRQHLRALVTWSAVSSFDRIGLPDREAWRRQGEITIVNGRTGQELPIGLEVLEDLEARREAYDLLAAAERRSAPWLIVHGESDETVVLSEAVALYDHAAPPRRLLRIAEGSHTLGAQHPFAGPTPQLIEALNATQSWFREHL
jgi:dipeptidyl aminopeptidase/acylaminoacyl peptidase